MTPEEMRVLYDYNVWANHRALDAAAALTNEQFVKPMGSSFSSVRDTLAHVCAADGFGWNDFRGGRPPRCRMQRSARTWRACRPNGRSKRGSCWHL